MRQWRFFLVAVGFAVLFIAPSLHAQNESATVRIGSKDFTEQEILGELIAQLIERHTDLNVERRFGLGGTDICHAALVGGELDIYVEYTGTALLNVLKREVISDPDKAFRTVARGYREQFNVHWFPPIGFNNTYAITVRGKQADEHGWEKVSDLAGAKVPLEGGFTSEFMERPDGYPGLKNTYGITFSSTVDLNPGLMYKAVADGQVDVICAFATDGRIAAFDLRTLEDDKRFFPPYDAAPIIRGDLLEAQPEIRDALVALAGTIDDEAMRKLNYAVDVEKIEPATVVKNWLDQRAGKQTKLLPDGSSGEPTEPLSVWELAFERRGEIAQKTWEHFVLTLFGVMIAIAIGVPIGITIHRLTPARGPVLAGIEILQTIPSLAMLAFLFAIYGLLGTIPAVTALVLYALLPIVLNTFTGLREVSPDVIEAANGVGMSGWQRLWMIELPLAAPVAIAGIRAATVLTVGIATLSTYIGAGGLGDFIARGLARTDSRLTLLGAVPAALMAVALSLLIRLIEKKSERT